MMGSWSYYPVSNCRHLNRTFIAVIFLFLGTEAAADPILPRVVFHPCLPKVLEVVKSPIPLPDPPPFSIGCLIPGCDLAVTGPLELRVELSGDLMPSALLEIDGLSQDQIRMLQLSGEVQAVPDQRTTFKVERGRSHVRGLRVDLGTRLQTEDLVTRLMEQTATPIIPTIQLRLSVDAEEAEKWMTKKGTVETKNAEPKIVIDLKMIQGKTMINESRTEYVLIRCYNIQTHPPDAFGPIGPITLDVDGRGVDWIHVTEQGMGGAAVALANGLIQNGSSSQWVGPEAYKATAYIPMLDSAGKSEDRIETNNKNNCATNPSMCAEVSVFAKDHSMTFSPLTRKNPPKDWKAGLGEIVDVPITQNQLLEVPVEFYFLWEHANDPQNPNVSTSSCPGMRPTTECMANWWLDVANTLWEDTWSGIKFKKRISDTAKYSTSYEDAACNSKTTVYSHFGLLLNTQQAVRVFFVRNSTDSTIFDINGRPASALGWTCPGALGVDTYNNIFISTATAYSTTLAHEFGHALSLWDVNKTLPPPCPSYPAPCSELEDWASDTSDPNHVYLDPTTTNLMWSGSMFRDNITKAQSFRANVNDISAVHRHQVSNRPLAGSPRECSDNTPTNICPAIYVDK